MTIRPKELIAYLVITWVFVIGACIVIAETWFAEERVQSRHENERQHRAQPTADRQTKPTMRTIPAGPAPVSLNARHEDCSRIHSGVERPRPVATPPPEVAAPHRCGGCAGSLRSVRYDRSPKTQRSLLGSRLESGGRFLSPDCSSDIVIGCPRASSTLDRSPRPGGKGGRIIAGDVALESQMARTSAGPSNVGRNPGEQRLRTLARAAARLCGLEGRDEVAFYALIERESGWNPHATSATGAYGLGQLFERTARAVSPPPPGSKNSSLSIYDPAQNLIVAACYLRQQIDRFGLRRGLHAYHDGPGAISRGPASAKAKDYASDIIGTNE